MRALRSAALLAALAPAWGGEPHGGYVYLTLDNDLIAGSDDGYTSGFQAGFASHALDGFSQAPLPSALAAGLEALPILGAAGRQRLVAASLVQRLFTPADLTRSGPVPGDLPYTAVLALSATVAAQERSISTP